MSLTGLTGQTLKDGRSFMAGRIGEQVTGPRFSLWDDALDARTLAIPFDVEGTPKQRVALVEAGVAKGVVHDRQSAKWFDTRSTGHAADPRRYSVGGHAGNLTMAGGDAKREQLIRAVKRGVLITRFHYTNTPDPKRATMTGTTRDGTFLIEDGQITRALANVRYTMSALDLFSGTRSQVVGMACPDPHPVAVGALDDHPLRTDLPDHPADVATQLHRHDERTVGMAEEAHVAHADLLGRFDLFGPPDAGDVGPVDGRVEAPSVAIGADAVDNLDASGRPVCDRAGRPEVDVVRMSAHDEHPLDVVVVQHAAAPRRLPVAVVWAREVIVWTRGHPDGSRVSRGWPRALGDRISGVGPFALLCRPRL